MEEIKKELELDWSDISYVVNQDDVKWLINRVEELEEEIENWRKVKEATVKLLGENKRYKQAFEEILNADCNLEGLDAERELDRVTDIALKALEGDEI